MISAMRLGLPIRRLLASNKLRPFCASETGALAKCCCPTIARISRIGQGPRQNYTATFKAQKTGEVFVYVNDAVIGIPGYFDYFYALNNKGKADLTLELLRDD